MKNFISRKRFVKYFGEKEGLDNWRKLKQEGKVIEEKKKENIAGKEIEFMRLFYCEKDTVYMEDFSDLEKKEEKIKERREYLEENVLKRMGSWYKFKKKD